VNISDLELHKNDICGGADTETHNVPDEDDRQLWLPDDAHIQKWYNEETHAERGALLYYVNINDFMESYQRIGKEIHLIQDASVPAHQKYCYHDWWRFDELELVACGCHGYSDVNVPWTFSCAFYYNNEPTTGTFCYWLSDSEDDDDENELSIDGWDTLATDGPLSTLPPNLDVPPSAWGTYGVPSGFPYVYEMLPGLNTGLDKFGTHINTAIIHKQLKVSFVETTARLRERSIGLPPLIPIVAPYGVPPTITPSIFGPHSSPVTIAFTVLENRKPDVKVTIKCDGTAITDNGAGPYAKTYDGGENSVITLESGSSWLSWKKQVSITWGGKLASGTLGDGTHTLTIQVEDADTRKSETRSVSVKYDAIAPTGTITVDGI
jgi:hypothetical protein